LLKINQQTCLQSKSSFYCQEKLLEQLNPFYDSNVNEPYFSLEGPKQGLDHAQKQGLTQTQFNKFLQKLLTTIDLPKLTKLYFQQIQNTKYITAV
jgi:hypothetical protein